MAIVLMMAAVFNVRAEELFPFVFNVCVAPLKFEDALNGPAGMFPDLWRLWAEKMGRDIRFVKTESFSESLDLLKSGAVDLHAGLFKTAVREPPERKGADDADYGGASAIHDVPAEFIITDANRGFVPDIGAAASKVSDADLVFICNPINPIGALIPSDVLTALCRSRPEALFIVDESYLPFVEDGDAHSLAGRKLPNVVVLNSKSKIFRVQRFRIGFLIGPPSVINRMGRYTLAWSVNALAQAAVVFLMENPDDQTAFIRQTRETLGAEQREFDAALTVMQAFFPMPSQTSFILMQLGGGLTADEVCSQLVRRRILICYYSNFKGISDRFSRPAEIALDLRPPAIHCGPDC